MDANAKISIVLNNLLQTHLLGAETVRHIEVKADDLLSEGVSGADLIRIMDNLKEKGLIEKYEFWSGKDAEYEEEPDYDIYNIWFSSYFRERASELVSEIGLTNNGTSTILYLDKNGDLWHGDKSKLCYHIGEDSERLKILTYLVDNVGLQRTEDISEYLGGKDLKNVRSEIGKIKKNIDHFLKVDIIESKSSSGYGIKSPYKVIKTFV